MARVPEPQYAHVEAVAGLARELDGLRRTLTDLEAVPERVDDLARAVADLADTVTTALTDAAPKRPVPSPPPSWLAAPADPDVVAALLEGLRGWLFRVYLRYSDAAGGLPECWLWHPEVVEELLWLHGAWFEAYQGPRASAVLAGDWHDRQRPGVVRRVRTYAGSCSRENHQTRTGWASAPRGPAPVPGVDACASILGWWTLHRDQPAPEPPADPTRAPHWDTGPHDTHRATSSGGAGSFGGPQGVRWS